MPADPSGKVVRFRDSLGSGHLSRPGKDGPEVNRQVDGPPSRHNQPAQQGPAEAAVTGLASGKASDAVAIYKRAALASGFQRTMLPDATASVVRTGLPDFVELDRCLRELSDLGIDPVQTGYRQTG